MGKDRAGRKVRSGFSYHLMEKPKQTFWPTQYLILLCLSVLFWKMEILINIVYPVELQGMGEILPLLYGLFSTQGVAVQSVSHVLLFVTPWTAARQASLSINNSQSFLKLMSIESVMPSNHLILCRPLLLLPSIFPSIRVFSSFRVESRY